MALRNQPYLPLYVQDFQTDEKLMECSASATGIYIRIMCIMHKSNPYGTILLKQNDKQSDKQILNFASKLAKFLPYHHDTIFSAINELVDNEVLILDGDMLIQKRMVKDNEISEIRSKAGKKGGIKNRKIDDNVSSFALAKVKANDKANIKAKYEANSEYENENVNENINNTKKGIIKFDEIEIEQAEVFHPITDFIKKNCPTVKRLKAQLTAEQADQLLSEFSFKEITDILEQMENWIPLTKKSKSVFLTAKNWLRRKKPTNGTTKSSFTQSAQDWFDRTSKTGFSGS